MRHSLGKRMPERDVLAGHPMLRPLARHVLAPWLWHLQHESVARGVAIGFFWAFVMPLGQIPIAVAHCIWWRANIPLSVAATLITNPLTLGFWLWLSYRIGTLFVSAPPLVMPRQGTSLLTWMQDVGTPVVLGMGLLAVMFSLGSYALIKLAWRLRVVLHLRQRRLRRRGRDL
ncbi:DUF2062 domain-containing protein [Ramlibacter rhizophilus]|uniref:DUF2062 domain-containing protein n=2 Tax=Ramlibacter rhizophilus TaxID=1781167 RepID=A0A4Z0BEI0_9BURK|nr:DUF2062 domain-containing protein [Ramlibacter rhizophilus]